MDRNKKSFQGECIGISGTRAQGLYILAMHKVFLNKCGHSPISWTDNIVLALRKALEVGAYL